MSEQTETTAAGNAAEAEVNDAAVAGASVMGGATVGEKPKAAAATPAAAAKEGVADTLAQEQEPVPEKYDFKLPEGVQFDSELFGEFTTAAKAAKLSQRLAEPFLKLGLKMQENLKNAVEAALVERAEAWRKESEADPEIGGAKMRDTVLSIRNYLRDEKVLGPDGAEELIKVLNETGLANYKPLLKALSVGARLNSEDLSVLSRKQEEQVKTVKSLYDKSELA